MCHGAEQILTFCLRSHQATYLGVNVPSASFFPKYRHFQRKKSCLFTKKLPVVFSQNGCVFHPKNGNSRRKKNSYFFQNKYFFHRNCCFFLGKTAIPVEKNNFIGKHKCFFIPELLFFGRKTQPFCEKKTVSF